MLGCAADVDVRMKMTAADGLMEGEVGRSRQGPLHQKKD